ncbi:MAG: TIGR02301 family protein [Methylocella sp.]
MAEAFPFARFKFLLRAAVAATAVGVFAEPAALRDLLPASAGNARAKALHVAAETGKGAKAKAEESAKPDAGKTEPSKTEADEPAAPGPPPPPYEPQILRLAEILGALAWLDDLCGSKSDWRVRMQQLLEAEAKTPERKERFAGSFNRSFHDYEQSYQTCTPNAEIIIGRFLSEGDRLARDVANRFSAS